MTSRPEKGDIAPAVTLEATDQQSVDLHAPRRRAQIVYFYPKDSTPGCTTEAQDFTALKGQFDVLGVDIIGVSRDSLKRHENFRTKSELEITLASDEDGKACEAFGVWVEKQNYGRTYMGIERTTFLILADGTIGEVWQKVRVKGHAETVLQATRAALD